MSAKPPSVVIRLGSHAEKEYVLKLQSLLDGIIVGANLFEASPGATASLIRRMARGSCVYFIDPMTYAFGTYKDRDGALRDDLDWIKSDQQINKQENQKEKDQKTETVRDFKRSYRALSEKIGFPLNESIRRKRAVHPSDLTSDDALAEFCHAVAHYQTTRLSSVLQQDELLAKLFARAPSLAADLPSPAAVFAPYFYNEPTTAAEWASLNIRLMKATAKLNLRLPVHGIVSADVSHLDDPTFLRILRTELPKTGISGIWLWFSRFLEDQAPTEQLTAFGQLVADLSKSLAVYNLHGGFLSLALSSLGLTGISHGVGYGEQKDVIPVIGQSTPTVRFYLPPLRKRQGVLEIERCFKALGIASPEDFHAKVCDCVVCRGVVVKSLADFSTFGELHISTPQSKRPAQTPAAAKRCRFHFLLTRLAERDWVREASGAAIVRALDEAFETWGKQPTLVSQSQHLPRWGSALEGKTRKAST